MMKSPFSQFIQGLAVTLVLSLAPVGAFAVNPLSNPRGLALDSAGNLWVANQGANNIIAFNPSYKLVTADTITLGISGPSGVAFDPNGNLWVTNFSGNNVTEYTKGVQQTANTITQNILEPGAITVDGLGDVWVQNNQLNVTLYTNSYNTPAQYVRTYNPAGETTLNGLAAAGPWIVFGGDAGIDFLPIADYFLAGYGPAGVGGNTGIAMAFDSHNDVYWSNLDGTIAVGNLNNFTASYFITLPFVASGIAVDSTRGRLYFADPIDNQILVYSATGTLLHTIK